MKLFMLCHGYPPYHAAGAEWMVHSLFKWMVAEKGCEVSVVIPPGKFGGENYCDILDGVRVYSKASDATIRELARDADVHFGHLDLTRKVVELSQQFSRPLVYVIHNPHAVTHHAMQPREIALALYNSNWLYRECSRSKPCPSLVLFPPVWTQDYPVSYQSRLDPQDRHITLLNTNLNKGAKLFFSLSEVFPEHKFLAVRGAYCAQITREGHNITTVPTSRDVNEIYAKSDIVLMPSKSETWGRVAVESASAGVPVLMSKANGLQEAMGPVGTFLDYDNLDAWKTAIEELDDDSLWYSYRDRLRTRALELEASSRRQLEALYEALTVIVTNDPVKVYGTSSGDAEALRSLPTSVRGGVFSGIEDGVTAMEQGTVHYPVVHGLSSEIWSTASWVGLRGGVIGKAMLCSDHESRTWAQNLGVAPADDPEQALTTARSDFFAQDPELVRVLRNHSCHPYGLVTAGQELYMRRDHRLESLIQSKLVSRVV